MRAKHPVRIVRDAADKTQEAFAKALGYNRCYVASVEVGKKPFTAEFQRKIAIFSGAWIGMDKNGKPAPPVFIEGWSPADGESPPSPWFHREAQPYQRQHWERWRGDWSAKTSGEPALRFDGDNEPLAFWVVLLIAGAERAGAAHAVRAEILHALERVRGEYKLAPAVDSILRQYKPLHADASSFGGSGRATWSPASRPPQWLKEAIELEPLSLHATPAKTKDGRFIKTLRRLAREGNEKFLTLLADAPGRAASWARENRPAGHWLVSLAKRVAERKFRTLLDEDEVQAVRWAKGNWADGDWQAILASWRKGKVR